MKFTMLPVLLLFAPIMAQSSVQLLKATVGGSAPIRCSLPGYPLGVKWFYWQEDKSQNILYHWNINMGTQQVSDKYKKRVQALSAEFSSGNFSIRLDNVTVGDDEKTFWARACVYDGQKSFCTPSEQRCDSRLQVSALYRDLHLTVNNTANVATCTARGGYPAPQVSWTGQNKSSGAHLDLQDAETLLQQDPSEETFSVTSSVSVKDLQSVTCLIYNPRCNQKIHKTSEVDAPDENQQMKRKHFFIPVIIFIIFIIIIITLIVFLWRRRDPSPQPTGSSDVRDSAEGNPSDASPDKSGRNESEEAVRLSENQAVVRAPHTMKLLQTDKDTTAAGADAETKLFSDSEECAPKQSPQKGAKM